MDKGSSKERRKNRCADRLNASVWISDPPAPLRRHLRLRALKRAGFGVKVKHYAGKRAAVLFLPELWFMDTAWLSRLCSATMTDTLTWLTPLSGTLYWLYTVSETLQSLYAVSETLQSLYAVSETLQSLYAVSGHYSCCTLYLDTTVAVRCIRTLQSLYAVSGHYSRCTLYQDTTLT